MAEAGATGVTDGQQEVADDFEIFMLRGFKGRHSDVLGLSDLEKI